MTAAFNIDRKHKNKGFTLIELVVVIVVLGILAAAAAPKFMDLQRDARIAKLHGVEAGIKSANEMLHAYAVIHGMDELSLVDGADYRNLGVRFEGGSIVRVLSTQANDEDTFFLNYGYVAATNASWRQSGLLQVIGRSALGSDASAKNYTTSSAGLGTTKCETDNADIDLCYFGTSSGTDKWTRAFIALRGYTGSECGIEYKAASRQTDGSIKMPVILINTSGC